MQANEEEISDAQQVVAHQPAISFSISLQHHINRAGGRTSIVVPEQDIRFMHHTPGHSPLTQADCKITTYEDGPLCVDVRFDSKTQLDDLIRALSLLRDATDFDHVHLQDHPVSGGQSTASTEIVFHFPGSCFDSVRRKMIKHAEHRIESNPKIKTEAQQGGSSNGG